MSWTCWSPVESIKSALGSSSLLKTLSNCIGRDKEALKTLLSYRTTTNNSILELAINYKESLTELINYIGMVDPSQLEKTLLEKNSISKKSLIEQIVEGSKNLEDFILVADTIIKNMKNSEKVVTLFLEKSTLLKDIHLDYESSQHIFDTNKTINFLNKLISISSDYAPGLTLDFLLTRSNSTYSLLNLFIAMPTEELSIPTAFLEYAEKANKLNSLVNVIFDLYISRATRHETASKINSVEPSRVAIEKNIKLFLTKKLSKIYSKNSESLLDARDLLFMNDKQTGMSMFELAIKKHNAIELQVCLELIENNQEMVLKFLNDNTLELATSDGTVETTAMILEFARTHSDAFAFVTYAHKFLEYSISINKEAFNAAYSFLKQNGSLKEVLEHVNSFKLNIFDKAIQLKDSSLLKLLIEDSRDLNVLDKMLHPDPKDAQDPFIIASIIKDKEIFTLLKQAESYLQEAQHNPELPLASEHQVSQAPTELSNETGLSTAGNDSSIHLEL